MTNNPVMGLVGHSWYGLGTVWFMNVHIDDYHFIGAHTGTHSLFLFFFLLSPMNAKQCECKVFGRSSCAYKYTIETLASAVLSVSIF